MTVLTQFLFVLAYCSHCSFETNKRTGYIKELHFLSWFFPGLDKGWVMHTWWKVYHTNWPSLHIILTNNLFLSQGNTQVFRHFGNISCCLPVHLTTLGQCYRTEIKEISKCVCIGTYMPIYIFYHLDHMLNQTKWLV